MSTTWFYYDSEGQKQGPVSGGRLKGLAKTGLITPETVVETEDGKTALAKKVKGLTFVELSVDSSLVSPDEKNVVLASAEETYGMKLPPPPPSPFTASLPTAAPTATPPETTESVVESPVAEPSKTANPFTAPPPVIEKPVASPFTAVMPATTKADSPFSATLPTASQPTSKSVSVLVAEKIKNLPKPVIATGMGVLLLVLLLTSVSYFGGGGRGGSGKHEQLKYALRFDGEFMDAVKKDNVAEMERAMNYLFPMQFPGCSPEFRAAHEKHRSTMMACYSARTFRPFDKEYYNQKRQEYIDSSRNFIKAIDEERKR